MRMRTNRVLLRRLLALAALGAVTALAGCGGDSSAGSSSGDTKTVTLVTHESFAVSKPVLAAFEKQSGLKVKVLRGGDAGAVVNQAILSKGNPQGDVLFGVDNTFLSRALDKGVFSEHHTAGLDAVPAAYRPDPKDRVTPVDFGDVCLNYDKAWFSTRHLTPPASFADLVKPQYKGRLVVENPATSSPGLAFLLGSIATYGEQGWQGYWKSLKGNGALVVNGWEEAYNQRFTVGSKGKGSYPIVVSYASSPPAEVIYAEKKVTEAPSAVVPATCFRQVEFAGLLDGAKNPTGGGKLLDFLLSRSFQQDVPLQMFVYPVVPGTPLPPEFTKYATLPKTPLTLPTATIAAKRDGWISAWTETVLR
jgi:thiamine transport system substrate-binding protein